MAIRVSAAELGECMRQAHAAGVEGLNLTLPHKQAALGLAARVEAQARLLGACNTLVRQERGYAAHNTDAPGLALALRRGLPGSILASERPAVVVGAGGAARAAVAALFEVGLTRVRVVARQPKQAGWARERGCQVDVLHPGAAGDCGVLIQATPLGLSDDDPSPIDAGTLPPDAAVFDLTYGPRPSRLLRQARARGCSGWDGLPMLVAQGALAFVLWRGGEPPLRVMAEAVGLAWD